MNPTKPLLNDRTQALIITPDGAVANMPTVLLSMEEAKLLRAYKTFLLRHNLQEVTRCLTCFEDNRPDWHQRSYVTNDEVLFKCSCRVLFYKGQTL